MKILYNHQTVGELTAFHQKVIKNDIPSEIFEEDMARRVKYWMESPLIKYSGRSRNKFVKELFEAGEKLVPADDLELAEVYSIKFPGPVDSKDISEDIEYQVGEIKFSFTKRHQIVNRKMLENIQQSKSKEKYKEVELNYLTDRLLWILTHKYEKCLARICTEWMATVKKENKGLVPIDPEEFCALIFSNPSYKDRRAREEEARLFRLSQNPTVK